LEFVIVDFSSRFWLFLRFVLEVRAEKKLKSGGKRRITKPKDKIQTASKREKQKLRLPLVILDNKSKLKEMNCNLIQPFRLR
jgi:hypothetical protein